MLPTPTSAYSTPDQAPALLDAHFNNRLPYGVEIPNRVFVGGLSYDTTELELRNFFHKFGTVRDSKIITDRQGVSKGYGFVTFNTAEEASKVQEQGSLYFNEKKLNVSKAIRKQGGQYLVPNQEYINGQRRWLTDGGMFIASADQDGTWFFDPMGKPLYPFLLPPMYPPTSSQHSYHGNHSPMYPTGAFYSGAPPTPMYNGYYYPPYLYSYRSSHHKDHFADTALSSTGEGSLNSEDQDYNDELTELEVLTQQLSLQGDDIDTTQPDHLPGKRRRPSRFKKQMIRPFLPSSPFHPTPMVGGAPAYAPLLPTPHLLQPVPPPSRYPPKS